MKIDDTTPLTSLTVGQLRDILDAYCNVRHNKKVYGIKGIRDLFDCSETRAHELKKNIISDAVSQNGRTIVTDVDKAMRLFEINSQNQKKKH